MELWQAVEQARPPQLRAESLVDTVHSLGRRHLNRRQNAIYGF